MKILYEFTGTIESMNSECSARCIIQGNCFSGSFFNDYDRYRMRIFLRRIP